MSGARIVIFAKAPLPGAVKTRLIAALGETGAVDLARRLLDHTVRQAIDAGLGPPELCAEPDPASPEWQGRIPPGVALSRQADGDLGQRLAAAALRTIDAGERVLLIGTDCPALTGKVLARAATRLECHDAVIHPAADGGYVLLGLARFDPAVFAGIPWSTERVAEATIARIAALGWSLHVGETLRDIDRPEDLPEAARWLGGDRRQPPTGAVVPGDGTRSFGQRVPS